MISDQVQPGKRLVDAESRELIERSGLDQTLFVEAGAGSGKTTLLVDRIVNLVLSAGVRLSSIAAITFTEAAASELQSRIRVRFEMAHTAAREAGDMDRMALCRAAVDDTDLAAITTLHGFANRMLSEFAVSAGLPPRIRVLDEVSSQLAHEARWERFVDRLYDDAVHQEVLTLASALQIPLEPSYIEQTTLRDVAAEFNQNWDRLGPLIDADAGRLIEPEFGLFDRAVDLVTELPARCGDPDDLFRLHLLSTVIPEMRAVRELQDPRRKLRLMMSFRRNTKRGWGVGRGGKAASWGGAEELKAAKLCIAQVNASLIDTLDPIVDDVLTRVCRLIAIETRDAALARRDEGGLEFHDLLVLARNMLRHDRHARQALHERYRYLLLDEFQDTDPIQIELAVLIATSANEVQSVPWTDLPVEDARLFFVGDPKQSIYRFRRADIALFLRARDRFAGPDGPIQLGTNFRTVDSVVAWVNAMFSQAMPTEISDRQPGYVPLTAHRATEDSDAHRPVLLGGPHPETKISAGDLRDAEASDVAQAVRTIMASPSAWPVFDRADEAWRPARLDDITILLPTRTSLPYLRSALDAAEIRYRIATGTLVYDTQEVRDALAVLRAIDDPTDELSLIAALRSPLYACSDVDLFTWRQATRRWDFRVEAPSEVVSDHPVSLAFAHLRSLWRVRWFMTPSALLERLLRERRATMLAFGDRRPVDVWRRLRFLVDQARAFEETGSGDLRLFTQWAGLQGASMARVHEPLLPETDEAALSIQTIHGAKGLEFPITILSGMTTQLRRNRPGVSVLWPDVGSPTVHIRAGVETRYHEPRADLEAEMDEHEKLRLAYVAATRARDHLLVSCHHKQGTADQTYGGRFWRAFEIAENQELVRHLDTTLHIESTVPEPSQPGLALDDRDGWIHRRRALLDPWRTPRVLSATGIAKAARPDAQMADEDEDGADRPDDAVVQERRRGRTGSAVGSAVHAVLHLVDLASPADVGALVVEQCEVEAIRDRSKVVSRLVESALGSSAVALAAQHPHHKELFVAATIRGRLIEGYVDLLIETPGGLIVVDYKTDTVRSDDDLLAKVVMYEPQAAAYAVALEAAIGQTVVECRFVFCKSSGAIERSVPDLVSAKRRVLATIEQVGAS